MPKRHWPAYLVAESRPGRVPGSGVHIAGIEARLTRLAHHMLRTEATWHVLS